MLFYLSKLYGDHYTDLFILRLDFLTLWLLSMSLFRNLKFLSCNMLTTTSPVTSSLSSSISWINKQFVLEYSSWFFLTLSNDSTLSFRPLSSYFKQFIIFSFSLQSFSNLSSFSDTSLSYCVRSGSFLLPLSLMDLSSLLRSFISDIFTDRVLRYSNTSEISFVVLTYYNTSSSAASLLLIVELPPLAFLSSSGLDSPLRSLFL